MYQVWLNNGQFVGAFPSQDIAEHVANFLNHNGKSAYVKLYS